MNCWKISLAALSMSAVLTTTGCTTLQTANAQELLLLAFVDPDTNSLSNDDFQLSVARVTRLGNAERRQDPYHLKLSETVTESNWIRGDGAIRFEQHDGESGVLLNKVLVAKGRIQTFDFVNDVTNDSEFTPTQGENGSGNHLPKTFNPNSANVISSRDRETGKDVWEITSSVDDAQLIASADSAIANLKLKTIQDRWVLDRSTKQLIEHTQLGIDTNGQQLQLFQIRQQPLRRAKTTELPDDWFELSRAAIKPVLPAANPNPFFVGEKLGAFPNGYLTLGEEDQRLAKLVRSANGLAESAIKSDQAGTDIRNSTQFGLASEQVFELPDDRVIALIQGPKEDLINLMRRRKATYTESKQVDLMLSSGNYPAWLATGSQFAQSPEQNILMFEHEDLFVYIVGQSITPDELQKLTSRLQRVGGKS
jgi:hypothetical protein